MQESSFTTRKASEIITKGECGSFFWHFHAVFFAVAAVALHPCLLSLIHTPAANSTESTACHALGPTITWLVVGWNVAFAAATYRSATLAPLFEYWRFVATCSCFMVIPDLFLVKVLETLDFPSDGAFMLFNAVSCYMAGMWSIPFLWILCGCHHDLDRVPSAAALLRAAVLALVIFGAAEHVLCFLHLWKATNRVQYSFGHVAVYVLPAEALLGPTVLMAYHYHLDYNNVTLQKPHPCQLGWRGWSRLVCCCILTMLLYTGALAVSFLFVEGSVLHASLP